MDFTFNRSGIRVPAIAISPWVAERTIVNDEYRHTSVIRTLRERWSLGAPLTARDAVAPDIAPILSREEPRNPSDWPDVVPLPVPKFDATLVPLDFPLGPLPRAIFSACLGLGKALGQSVPDIAQDADVKGYDALTMVRDMFFNVFPGLQSHS
jgi:phospholipase C